MKSTPFTSASWEQHNFASFKMLTNVRFIVCGTINAHSCHASQEMVDIAPLEERLGATQSDVWKVGGHILRHSFLLFSVEQQQWQQQRWWQRCVAKERRICEAQHATPCSGRDDHPQSLLPLQRQPELFALHQRPRFAVWMTEDKGIARI